MPRATSVDPDTSLRRSARNTGKKTYVESDSEGEEEEGYDNDNDESDEEDYTSKSRLRSKKSGGPQRKRAKRAGVPGLEPVLCLQLAAAPVSPRRFCRELPL